MTDRGAFAILCNEAGHLPFIGQDRSTNSLNAPNDLLYMKEANGTLPVGPRGKGTGEAKCGGG